MVKIDNIKTLVITSLSYIKVALQENKYIKVISQNCQVKFTGNVFLLHLCLQHMLQHEVKRSKYKSRTIR